MPVKSEKILQAKLNLSNSLSAGPALLMMLAAALALQLPAAETVLLLACQLLFVLLTAEVCVCDLAKLLGMTQSAVSHQLRVLKQARLIKARRDGKTVFYSLADDHVATLLRQGMEHVCEGGGGECGE